MSDLTSEQTERLDEALWGGRIYDDVPAVVTDLIEQAKADERERIATTLDDLALGLVVSSDSNPTGNSLTGAIVYKCAEIARQVPA